MKTIPVNEPLLGERELELVSECVRTGWVSSAGPHIPAFEEAWASYCGRRYGVAVANGTAALELALVALDLQPGDEVILPSFTIISCALAVIRAGGTPVWVDAEPQTWCMDPEQVRARIGQRTRAILAVHIYGHPADMNALTAIAEEHGVPIIEDAAEAHGAEVHSAAGWRRCGSFGLASCFSFYANKLVTTGEGGMVLTDDSALADRLRGLRNLCFGQEERFRHEGLGFNYRMTNMQAALGVAQVERIDEIVARKRRQGARYSELFADLGALELPVEEPWAHNVYWMYGVVLGDDHPFDGRAFAAALAELGVGTRPFFLGMHEQPALRTHARLQGEQRYPVTERLSRRGIYLPSGLALSDQQQDEVCARVRDALAGAAA